MRGMKTFPVSKNIEDRTNDPKIEDIILDFEKNYPIQEGKGDIVVPDKTITEEPSGDIGGEMQQLRGYGKARVSRKWRIR